MLDDQDHIVDIWTDVLAPYEVFHHMYMLGDFAKCMLSDNLSLYEYWEHVTSRPWASKHPMFGNPHLWKYTVPLNYFTDGAEFSKSSSAEGLQQQNRQSTSQRLSRALSFQHASITIASS